MDKLRKCCPDCNEEFSAYFEESLDTIIAIHRLSMHGANKLSIKIPEINKLTSYDIQFLKDMRIAW